MSLPVRSEPGMSLQVVTCICEVIFLQVSPVTGRRQPRAAWGLLGGGYPVWRLPSLSSAVALIRQKISSDFFQSSLRTRSVHLARRAAAQDAALQRRLLCNSIWIQFARLASWGESKSSVEKVFVELFRSRWPRDCRRGTLQPSLNWLLLLSCLLYKRKRSTFPQNAETWYDSVLLAALEADIPQVVRELCLSLDNFRFSAHLLDLLHHAGALGQAEGDQHGGRERPAQHSHSDMQGAWHESASKWQQRSRSSPPPWRTRSSPITPPVAPSPPQTCWTVLVPP